MNEQTSESDEMAMGSSGVENTGTGLKDVEKIEAGCDCQACVCRGVIDD